MTVTIIIVTVQQNKSKTHTILLELECSLLLEKVPSLEHNFFPVALATASGPVASQAACMSSRQLTVIYWKCQKTANNEKKIDFSTFQL